MGMAIAETMQHDTKNLTKTEGCRLQCGTKQEIHEDETNNKLSYRKETVQLLRGSVLAKYNWKTIFCGHWLYFFNHCDVISLRIRATGNSRFDNAKFPPPAKEKIPENSRSVKCLILHALTQ